MPSAFFRFRAFARSRVKASHVLLVACALFLQSAFAAVSSSELAFRKSFGVETYVSVRYKNEAGLEVSHAEFVKLIPHGKGFSISKDPQAQAAVFSVTATETSPSTRSRGKELSISVGQAMPPLKLVGTDGREYSWEKLSGNVVLLSFFFAECPPCIQEIPELNEFAKKNPDVDVLSVTFESKADALKFAHRYKFDWPIASDARTFIDAMGVKAYPTLLLISRDRKLIGTKVGGNSPLSSSKASSNSLEKWVKDLRP